MAARVLYKDWNEPTQPLRKPRLGIPEGPYLESASEESIAHFERICQFLENAGYELHRHSSLMADFAEIHSRHDVIMSAEAAQVHEDWFEQISESLFDEIRRTDPARPENVR